MTVADENDHVTIAPDAVLSRASRSVLFAVAKDTQASASFFVLLAGASRSPSVLSNSSSAPAT